MLGAEPLTLQLVLVHGQIVSLLTATALSAMFARNSGYDARKLLGASLVLVPRCAVGQPWLFPTSASLCCSLASLWVPAVVCVCAAAELNCQHHVLFCCTGGSDGMLSALVDSFTTVPATLLGAYPSLPMLGGVRQALATALAAAVKVILASVLRTCPAAVLLLLALRPLHVLSRDEPCWPTPPNLQATSAVHGLVVAGGQVAMLCAAAGAGPMQQWDVLLLLNLLGANQSFRHSGEAMTPVCLPRYNSGRWGANAG